MTIADVRSTWPVLSKGQQIILEQAARDGAAVVEVSFVGSPAGRVICGIAYEKAPGNRIFLVRDDHEERLVREAAVPRPRAIAGSCAVCLPSPVAAAARHPARRRPRLATSAPTLPAADAAAPRTRSAHGVGRRHPEPIVTRANTGTRSAP